MPGRLSAATALPIRTSRLAAAIGTGPATADALWISRAITTPPSAAGWTIQFMPRRAMSLGTGAAGSWALAVARSIALRIAATSASVQATGSVGWTMVSVNTWLLPRSMISTDRRIGRLLPEQDGERVRRGDRLLAGEMATDVGGGGAAAHRQRREPRQRRGQRRPIGRRRGIDGQDDRVRQVGLSDGPLERPRVVAIGRADHDDLRQAAVPRRQGHGHERHD